MRKFIPEQPLTMDAPAAGTTALARIDAQADTVRLVVDALSARFESAAVAAIEDASGNWSIEIYFHQMPDQAAVRDAIAKAGGARAAHAVTFSTVHARDWTAASLADLHPVDAGRFIVHGAHDRAQIAPNRLGIEIEAALAFGTGHHGTTRGCLLALDRILKARRPRRILDIGTGTGVLAIAAAKSLRQRVLATDIDRQAVVVAQANARANRAGGAIKVVWARGLAARDIRERAPFDLVFANILLEPLKSIAAPMARLLAPNARIILSGLLANQDSAALAAYRAQNLRLEASIRLEGWVTLQLTNAGP
jgi:ribosomal protein L11 methyltransferase